jgi:ATP-binding cassette subfamily C protein
MYRPLLSDAFKRLGWWLPTLAALILIASFLEGVGLTMLLPLLATFGLSDDTSGDGALAQVVNDVLDTIGVSPELGSLMTVIVIILVLQTAMIFAVSVLETRLTTQYTADWRRRLFQAVIEASWGYLQDTKVEVQTNQIIAETSRNSAALSLALQIIKGVFFVFVYALIACFTAWQVVIGLSVFGAMIWLLTRPISKRSRQVGMDVTSVSETLNGRAYEFLLNAKLIKATAMENTAQRIIGADIEGYRRTYFQAGVLPASVQAIYMGLGYIVLGAGVWSALTFLEVSPAAAIVTIYVFLRLYTQLSNIQQLRQSFLLSAPALENCQNELRTARARREYVGEDGDVLDESGGVDISIHNLTVAYGDRRALSSISVDIPAGSVLGLTGPSGAGKSTMVDAIVGLVVGEEGDVKIDGYSIETLSPQYWRKHIGYVAQETLIIRGSVADNIAWGMPDATRDQIRTAAHMANANEFIETMADGYDTIIGGRSIRMSGGQRQRIGLARALLGSKRLLILDEATSALDSTSEQKVLDAVAHIKGNVTVVMVAHRLSTLKLADSILVFDEGKIIEQGPFDTLANSDGAFSQLWRLQTANNQASPAK